jgi:ATP-binding protein involved in chromosome partitioning
MKLTNEVVLSALSNITLPNEGKNIVDSGAVKNIQIFGTDVELDVEIKVPTLQYKKRVEVDCIKAIHDHAFEKSKVKVNLIINAPEIKSQIKGVPIPGIKNIIAISSGKGGVGKSTVSANFAVGLADLGYKVGVIDADIYGPSMHIMFGLQGESPKTVMVDGKSKIQPLVSHGVKLLSIGFFRTKSASSSLERPYGIKGIKPIALGY